MTKRFKGWQPPKVVHGKPTKWGWRVDYPEGFRNGFRTDIGAFTYIQARHGVELGDDVQIGSHCSLYSVSTIDGKRGKVVIKKGARIGSHSVIMPGVTIGRNAVVGACSFVNRDIPDNSTAFGVPAREVKEKGEEVNYENEAEGFGREV